MQSLAEAVLILRKDKGWTRRELARRSQVKETHLVNIEHGLKTKIDLVTLAHLCRAFGCTADAFLALAVPADAAPAAPSGEERTGTQPPLTGRWSGRRQTPRPAAETAHDARTGWPPQEAAADGHSHLEEEPMH